MNDVQKKLLNAIISYCKAKGIKNTAVSNIQVTAAAKASKCRSNWAFLASYLAEGETKVYDFSTVSLSAPKTAINLGASVADAFDRPQISMKEDPKILAKYEDIELPDGGDLPSASNRGIFDSKETLIVVTNPDDGFVVGITRSFDTAWDILKKRRLHDNGEFTDKKVARKYFQEKGRLVLKGGNFNGYCVFEKVEVL